MDPVILRNHILKVLQLPDEDISLLLSCAEGKSLKKGEILLNEGDYCNSFYFVENGFLRTYYNKNGTAINIAFTFEGGFTTNLKCFKQRIPSDLIIEAGEETIVWGIQFRKIASEADQHAQISKFIRRITINMLLIAEEYSKLFRIYTPQERYHYIAEHAPQLIQRVSLSQIASYLGVARETLSRIRARN